MSTIRTTIDDSLLEFAHQYGLTFVMVASYFGSGSVFIASQAGVMHGSPCCGPPSAPPCSGSWLRT
nr:hypothetical protein [Halovivax sp.]